MSSFRIRPQFSQIVNLSLEATRDRLLHSLAQQAPGFEVKSFPAYICLHILEQERHFWSPRLALSLQATPEGGTRIEGTYGPDAEVWSLFLYGYIGVGMLGIFAGIVGGTQLMIGSDPWGLRVLAGLAVIAALMYLSAQLGQKLGAWQTFQLHQAYQTAIGQPAEIQ